MKTDDLIKLLAADAGVVKGDVAARRYALALGSGAFCSGLLVVAILGVNPALAKFVLLPMFWVKVVFVASLTAIGVIAVQRLSRPGVRLGWVPVALAAPVLAMWMLAIALLVLAAPAERAEAFFGQTWTACPFLVAMLSAPVFVAMVWAMKGLAPTRLRLAGAAAGFVSGAVGALIYCLHCPELAAPFIGFWYLLGILIPTLLGALLGRCLLRW